MRWSYGMNKPEAVYQEGTRPRKFLACAVWNYATESVQLWEITQSSVINSLDDITRDADYGHPNRYDLKISRTGEGLENAIPFGFRTRQTCRQRLRLPCRTQE